MLAGYETTPGRQLPPVAEVARVGDRGEKGARGDVADAEDGLQPLGVLTVAGVFADRHIAFVDARIDLLQMFDDVGEDRPEPRGQPFILRQVRQLSPQHCR